MACSWCWRHLNSACVEDWLTEVGTKDRRVSGVRDTVPALCQQGGGDDFASTFGIGGIISTKFTWPLDPKPKDSFLLTAEREKVWRKWIALYNERRLPQGTYRGELYEEPDA
jgi:hypothetical protein